MPSMFETVFGCCLRQRHLQEHDPIDETTRLLPPTIDPPVTIYTEVEPPDQQYVKERMGHIVRAKQSKMVNILNATNDGGLQTSRSNGSTSRTRERPLRTSSRSPPPSTRSDSSTSLLRTNSALQVPYSPGPSIKNIRIIKGGLRGLERGRSQTLKRRTLAPETAQDPSGNHSAEPDAPANEASENASSRATTPPTDSQESLSSPHRPASLDETPKQTDYVFEGVSELTGGWGD